MADSNLQLPTDFIIMGSTGVGKSTIASNVSGAEFKAGVSYGGGIIPDVIYAVDQKGRNNRYFDTPGLNDVKAAKKAAELIQTALLEIAKGKRPMKLIFVINLRSGRVDSSDIFLINQVLSSIELSSPESLYNNGYTVLINKMPKKLLTSEQFSNGGQFEIESCFQKSNLLKYSTDHIYYIENDPTMEDETNAKFSEITLKLLECILLNDITPAITGVKGAKLINTDNYDKRVSDAKLEYQQEMKENKKKWEAKSEAERKKLMDEFNAKKESRGSKIMNVLVTLGKLSLVAGVGFVTAGYGSTHMRSKDALWILCGLGTAAATSSVVGLS